MDVVVSANPEQGKNKYSELRTTVFKKNPDVTSDLKTKASRTLLNEIYAKCGPFAFSINDFEDPNQSKLGLSECVKSNHLQPYEVLEEKSGADVVQFKWTVGVMGGRNILLGAHLNNDLVLDVKLEGENTQKV